jgi:hypothetical protein
MMRRLLHPLWVLLALVFLFEAWLWDRLGPIVGWIVARIGWAELKARLAARIEPLPPPAALLVFLLPVLLLLPLKFLGLWMLAHGSWLGAAATLLAAKLAGMGLAAFILDVTRPKLLQIAWFRWLYVRVLAGLAWAHRMIDPVKQRLQAWLRLLKPPQGGRLWRRLEALRRRARAS